MNLPQQAVFCRYFSRIWCEQLFQLTMNCMWSTRNESHCSFSLLTVFLLKRKEVFYLVSYLYVAVASFGWDSGFLFAWKVEKCCIWSFAIWELNGVTSWIWMYVWMYPKIHFCFLIFKKWLRAENYHLRYYNILIPLCCTKSNIHYVTLMVAVCVCVSPKTINIQYKWES